MRALSVTKTEVFLEIVSWIFALGQYHDNTGMHHGFQYCYDRRVGELGGLQHINDLGEATSL